MSKVFRNKKKIKIKGKTERKFDIVKKSEKTRKMAEDNVNVGIMGLKPPSKMESLSAEEFKKFKQRFEIYRIASGAAQQPEDVQVALLLHCIGPQCLEVYNTLELTETEKQRYEVVLSKLENHFIPTKNESVASHMFFTRNQHEHENFDAYLTELRKLSSECDFGSLQDRLIRDKIVTGIRDNKLKDRLLREQDLTLQKAINICKAAELAMERMKEVLQERTVNKIDRKRQECRQENKETRASNENNGARRRPENANGTRFTESRHPECSRCGYRHEWKKCPAYGQQCKKCKRSNHFARKCRARNVKELFVEEEDQEFSLNMIYVNSVGTSEWSENVYFVESRQNINFKLDTGAQCNVLPKSKCNEMGIYRFEKSNLKLYNYNGDPIPTVGQVTLKCKIGNVIKFINFQVCDNDLVPILGLTTVSNFNLIKRVNNVQSEETKSLLTKYENVFTGLGQIKNYEYKIELKENSKGKIEPCRHVPFKLMSKLKNELEDMERNGVISKIEKPTDFVSSLVITTKPDGSIRVCLDPQYLNTQIKREQIMIPTLEEITAKLNGSCIFSTLDASKAFFMLKLSEDSRELTTFNTPYGRYCFNRLPFGLSSSPEVFHRVYSNVFKDIEGVEVYIDDLLIHSKSEQEHDRILEKVLNRAQEVGIKFNKNKCRFKQKEVKYLGHVLTTDGIKIDRERVKAIIDMKEPTNQKELLRFLGMINYISRFIKNVSEITAPLRELIKKDVDFLWGDRQKQAYNLIKKLISEPPVLAYYKIDKKITLSVDASKDGLGAVLLQDGQPVAYGSRALTETEKLYSQIEKESLAILYGCTKFNQYVYGNEFVVETDHKPLVSIFSKPLNKSPTRLQRIRLALQPYTFNLIFKPGKELVIADHLSRSYLNDNTKTYELELKAHVAMVVKSFKITDQKLKELIEETDRDKELCLVRKYVREGWPENKWEIESEAKCYFSYRDELGECEGLLMKGNQIVIPRNKRKEVLGRIHYAHLGMDKCKRLARKSIFWPNMNKEIEDIIQNCDTCKTFQNNNRKESMIDKEIPEDPWQILATDIFFLYQVPYLLVVDDYSKFIEIQQLNNLSARSTIESLKQIFSRHGLPEILYSDPGSQFTSQEFRVFAKLWNFQHKITSPKYHQANGLAERHIQTIKKTLKKLIYDNKDIYLGLLIYRNTPISESGKSPAELLFNRNVKNWLPNVRKEWKYDRNERYQKELIERQVRQKEYYNKGCRDLPDLTNGDTVKIQNENKTKPHGSGIILGRGDGPRSYKIKNENGDIITRNRRMLIKGGQYKDKSYNLEDSFEGIGCEIGSRSRNSIGQNQERALTRSEDNTSLGLTENNPTYTTRSGRTIKRPIHLKDYI